MGYADGCLALVAQNVVHALPTQVLSTSSAVPRGNRCIAKQMAETMAE
jgi:hypothetical protein